MDRTLASHRYTSCGVNSPARLILHARLQSGTEVCRRDLVEAEACVEWHVPGQISVGGERDRLKSFRCRPLANAHHEACAEPTASVVGMNVELLEMRRLRLEQIDVRKTNRSVVEERHPEQAIALRLFMIFLARRLGKNRLGCMSDEEPRGSKLDHGQRLHVLRPCRDDPVVRCRRAQGRRAEALMSHVGRKAMSRRESSTAWLELSGVIVTLPAAMDLADIYHQPMERAESPRRRDLGRREPFASL